MPTGNGMHSVRPREEATVQRARTGHCCKKKQASSEQTERVPHP